MASNYTDLLKFIRGGSKKQQERIAQAIHLALSQSAFSKLYIPTVLNNPGFFIEIDLDNNPSLMAEYSGQYNRIAFFLNNRIWDISPNSLLVRTVLHEFLHAFCAILHAPNHAPHSYPRDAVFLLQPFIPANKRVTAHELQELKTYLEEGHTILSNILLRYFTAPEEFALNFPRLLLMLEECLKKYYPRSSEARNPKITGDCETSYPDAFEQLKQGDSTQFYYFEGPGFIAYGFKGESSDKECVFLGYKGSLDWPPELNQLFSAYNDVALLRSKWFEPMYRTRFKEYRSTANRVDFYVYMEADAFTSELGPFSTFYNRLGKRRLEDIRDNMEGLENAPTIEEFEKALLLPSGTEEEIKKILENPVTLISPAELARKIDAQHASLGLNLLIFMGNAFPMAITMVSYFVDAGTEMLARIGAGTEIPSVTEAPSANEKGYSTEIYAASALALAGGLGYCYYSFWRGRDTKEQASKNVSVPSKPGSRLK